LAFVLINGDLPDRWVVLRAPPDADLLSADGSALCPLFPVGSHRFRTAC